jgi:hypothetical protein
MYYVNSIKIERKEKIMNELKKYRNMIVYIIVMILGYSIDIFICYICPGQHLSNELVML